MNLASEFAAVTDGWSAAQKAALAERLHREATRMTVNRDYPTAGALARSIDKTTVQTPAMEALDDALEWALTTPDARLIVSLPPQQGKSVRLSIWGVIRALVQNPSRRIVVASYSDALARNHARAARDIIRGNGSSARDPLTSAELPDRLGIDLASDHAASGSWRLAGHRGGCYAVGVGGSLTGSAADCVVSDTGIMTSYGVLTAAEIHRNPPEYVLGYDHVAGRASWRRLEATRRIPGRRVVTVETEAGNILTCTPDHRVYTSRGYVPAGSLRPGEALLYIDASDRVSELRDPVHEGKSGHTESYPAKRDAGVLASMRSSRNGGEDPHSHVRLRSPHTAQPEVDMLGCVPSGTAGGPGSAAELPRVRHRLPAEESSHGVLREDVRRPGALEADAQLGELELQDGHFLRSHVPVDAANRDGTRWVEVRRLPSGARTENFQPVRGRNGTIKSRGASHQRADGGQSTREPDHLVPSMSHAAPQVREDTVRLVRGGGDETHAVYDLQVEGTRNFFADGVLVHNCLFIDDPLKGMAEADSQVERDKVITWWETVAQTRLAPGAPVVIIMTRWHEKDLAGHVLAQDAARPLGERRWRVVNIPAIATPGVPDALGRDPGQPLVSTRGHTLADWQRIREEVGPRAWSALYLGTPTPGEGGLFSQDWFDRHRLPSLPDTAVRIVSIDPAETGRRDEAGLVAMAATTDGRVCVTDDWSARMQSDVWARKAVLLALEAGATEILFEAFTTGPTYERVIQQAWRDVRDDARTLRAADGNLDAAIATVAGRTDPPADPRQAVLDVDGVVVPDQDTPPFHIKPWRAKGDKTARAAGTRQAASTGRLRMVGTHPVLEGQAVHWQQGQDSPDRLDAMVNGYERCIQLVGGQATIAVPGTQAGGQSSAPSTPSGGFSFNTPMPTGL